MTTRVRNAAALSLALVLPLGACGGGGDSAKKPDSSASATSATSATTAAAGGGDAFFAKACASLTPDEIGAAVGVDGATFGPGERDDGGGRGIAKCLWQARAPGAALLVAVVINRQPAATSNQVLDALGGDAVDGVGQRASWRSLSAESTDRSGDLNVVTADALVSVTVSGVDSGARDKAAALAKIVLDRL